MSFFTFRSGALGLLCLAANGLAAPPIEHFFSNAAFHSPQLSPNGKLLAISIAGEGRRDALMVLDLIDRRTYATARFRDTDIGDVQWVNEKRLVFSTRDKQLALGALDHAPGLYAADFDGGRLRQLAEHRGPGMSTGTMINRKIQPWNTYLLAQRGAQDSDSIYVVSPVFNGRDSLRHVSLIQLDTVNGKSTTVARPGDTQQWLLDQRGAARMAITRDGATATLHLREAAEGAWKPLRSYPSYGGAPGTFTPVALGPDDTLYVKAHNGKDTSALYTYDLASGKLGELPLISTGDYDFDGALIFSRGKLIGASVTTDATAQVWFDPAMKALQAEIDARLPGTNNLLSIPTRPETPWVLVSSYSDRQPRVFFLYNTETKVLDGIGATRPAIKPAEMGTQDAVRYQARDGLRIPAWLTLPPGGKSKNLPLVVLVHGGPWVRGGSWGWQADVQFLASRGYAVLEPEFRGSAGYGQKHFRAGFKQWGLAMQNDIADGARWAVAQGYADPQRICIAGASYGGYATLMGLINDPDLYKCGINWVGVTDINLMYNGHWSFETDLSANYRQHGMPLMVGDQVKDAAQLAATSPLLQAAKVTRPLLLAYGGADRRVPLYHGEKFYKEVNKTNPAVEWVVYPDEGHGWTVPANRIDFWTRVEKFLEKHIGK